MKQYWPMAIALDNEKPIQLFTYDSCLSIEMCEKVFQLWQDAHHYTLLSTWIKANDKIITLDTYVNAIGQIRRYEKC